MKSSQQGFIEKIKKLTLTKIEIQAMEKVEKGKKLKEGAVQKIWDNFLLRNKDQKLVFQIQIIFVFINQMQKPNNNQENSLLPKDSDQSDGEQSTQFISTDKTSQMEENPQQQSKKIWAIIAITVIALSAILYLSSKAIKASTQKQNVLIEDKVENKGWQERQLRNIPKHKRALFSKENKKLVEKEYLALRIKNWKEDAEVLAAEDEYNQVQHKLSLIPKQLSICIPINVQGISQTSASRIIQSIERQKYENYRIFVYSKNGNQLTVKNKEKVQMINGEMGDMKECAIFDIVLMMKEGELIGRYVLQRINAAYQKEQIHMTFSNVLSFSNSQKIPVSRNCSSENADFVQNLFSQFLWSYRTKYLAEVNLNLGKVKKLCAEKDVDIAAFSLKMVETYQILNIDEFDLFVEKQSTNPTSCIASILSTYTSLTNDEISSLINRPTLDQKLKLSASDLESVSQKLYEEPSKVSLWHRSPKPENPRKANETTYFFYRLSLDPDNIAYHQAQYMYYQSKYNISVYTNELPFCIISAGRNNNNGVIQKYLGSLARQNYSNFHVVYVDDVSDDGSVEKMEEVIFLEYPEMKDKITIVKNTERIYSLGNRYRAVTQYCRQDEVVIDMDADDELIGCQVIKLFNMLYQSKDDVWVAYSNHLTYDDGLKQPMIGISKMVNPDYFAKHTIRLHNFTMHNLRSFSRKLFMKIDENYFKNEKGTFYRWVADTFIYFALVEMAGPQRIVFSEELTEKYQPSRILTNVTQKKKDAFIAKGGKPFQQLESLDSVPNRVSPNVSQIIFDQLLENATKFYTQLQKTFKSKQSYKPNVARSDLERNLQSIQKSNDKTFINSSSSSLQLAIFAEYMRKNKDAEAYALQTYFYDNRFQILYFRNEQIPILVVVEVENSKKYFEILLDSLIPQEYSKITYVFVCEEEQDEKFMFSFIIQYYPMFLQRAFFVQRKDYPNVSSIVDDFCTEESILIQLPMKAELVGSEVFRFVNNVFHQHEELKIFAASSMMRISEKRIQIKEINPQALQRNEYYLNYHKQSKSIVAIKVNPKQMLPQYIERQKIKVVQNIFTSFPFDMEVRGEYSFELLKEKEDLMILLKKKFMDEPPSSEKSLKSYVREWIWKNSQVQEVKDLQTYIYKKNYDLGKYKKSFPFCVVSLAVNPVNHKKFFTSLEKQTYQNYNLVLGYLNPSFHSQLQINEHFEKNRQKIRTIKYFNEPYEKRYIQMKAQLIQKYCKDDEFVVDIDGNDEFVGRQALNLLNTYLQKNPEFWFLVSNSLYKKNQLILPSSPPIIESVWENFYHDHVKVYKKALYLNAVSRPFITEQSHINLMMYHLSGQRFDFLKEFLCFDTNTDTYDAMDDTSQSIIWNMLNNPCQQLKYPEDKKEVEKRIEYFKQKHDLSKISDFTVKRKISRENWE